MSSITENTIIHEIFDQWPHTAVLFNRFGMSCPGCYMDQFERLGTALKIYKVPVEPFLREINSLVNHSTNPQNGDLRNE